MNFYKNTFRHTSRALAGAFLLLHFSFTLYAQSYGRYYVPVQTFGNRYMAFPWLGGFNTPQFSNADINGDGIPDLIVFERSGDQIFPFINNGTKNSFDYTYHPEYASDFPPLHNWAIFKDYNHDGVTDIFTYDYDSIPGIRVYKGSRTPDHHLSFTLQKSFLTYPFNGFAVNLYVSNVDIPAIVDVNFDGDLDVLTYQITGNYVEYYENQSEERGYGSDSLIYNLIDNCWGDFYESSFSNVDSLNVKCPFQLVQQVTNGRLHSGNALIAFDFNGDHLTDLMHGSISFPDLTYLQNGGTLEHAHITSQDSLFPSYDKSVDLFIFPAAFAVDVNNDGLKDLLVSPNSTTGSENYHCVWYYKNEGDSLHAHFHFQYDTLFTGDMIDVGEGNYPAFEDVDGDGLKDLIIGNYGYYNLNANYKGELAYFKNTGTADSPAFKFITKDFGGISQYNLLNLMPTFGDLDGDGDDDLIVGRDDGTLIYFENTAAKDAPMNLVLKQANFAGIDVGNYAAPQLVDVDGDGLLDLIIGNADGTISYYKNTGTKTSPAFTLMNDNWGGVNVRVYGFLTGYSTPCLTTLDPGQGRVLLVGNEQGTIYEYGNIDGNIDGTFTLIDSALENIQTGDRSAVTVTDLNNDGKPEILVGNYRGGATMYSQSAMSGISSLHISDNLLIYPNPAHDRIHVQLPQNYQNDQLPFSLMDVTGKTVFTRTIKSNELISLPRLPTGCYLAVVKSAHEWFMKKIIIE